MFWFCLQLQHARTSGKPQQICQQHKLRPVYRATLAGVAWTVSEDSGSSSSSSSSLVLWCASALDSPAANMPSFTTSYTSTSGGVAWRLSKDPIGHAILLLENYFSASSAIRSSVAPSVTSKETRGEPAAAAVDGNKTTAAASSSRSTSSNSNRLSAGAVPWGPTPSISAACDKKKGLKRSKRGWKAATRCFRKAAAVAKELLQACWSPEGSVKK